MPKIIAICLKWKKWCKRGHVIFIHCKWDIFLENRGMNKERIRLILIIITLVFDMAYGSIKH